MILSYSWKGSWRAHRGPANFPPSRYTPAHTNGPTTASSFPVPARWAIAVRRADAQPGTCQGVNPFLNGLPGDGTPVVGHEGSQSELAASRLPQPKTIPLLPPGASSPSSW